MNGDSLSQQAGKQIIDVERVAGLARLSLSEEERAAFQAQLERVIGYVREIEAIDVENVAPTARAVPIFNVFRADVCRKGLDRDLALANAPERDDQQFLVPRMV